MCRITRHDGQIMNESRGGDLFVERVFWVRDTQSTPNVRGFLIKRQDRFRIRSRDLQQPSLQPLRLTRVSTIPEALDALPQFPYCHDR